MSRFVITDTLLTGLKVVQRQAIGDHRGFLSRVFGAEDLASAGWVKPIAQINHTYTQRKGTVRGLHFQRDPHADMKLVSCVRGAIWDVAVDLRPGSPGYLQWHAEELSAENGRALLIPEGFAHGFQTLTDDCDLVYLHSAAYAPGAEGGVSPSDPRLAIPWPLPIADLSARDRSHPPVRDDWSPLA
ncbi:MAG: dTDP-4-keto-6-deoxy-D-glucose epimerase [Gemmatimonadetes bacterium]|nr:dTDP-4-keto-6-deoxy-D-glucose epimerase [Gemmatimonadota bacterium]